jgi:drug/metabolite transporter (DMT)-like permease
VAYLSFLFLCLVWGSNFILMERISHAFGPVANGIGRLAGGSAVLALVWWLGRRRYHISASDWVLITLVTFLSTAVPFVIQPYLVARGFGHSFFGMMVPLVPLVTIVASVPMLDVWPSVRQVVGVLGGLVCMAFIVDDGTARGMSAGLLALAVLVPCTYAVGNTFVKWKLSHVPALPLTTLLLAVAALMLAPLQLSPGALDAMGLAGPAEPHDWPLAVAALVFSGVVCTGIAVLVFVHLIIQQGPLFAGMVTYVVPVLALLWGMFDNETITPRQLAAMAGVLAMVALVQVGAARHVGQSQPRPQAAESHVRSAGRTDDEADHPKSTDIAETSAPLAGPQNSRHSDLPGLQTP